MTSVPLYVRAAVGENRRPRTQEAPGARLVPQLLDAIANAAASGPSMAMAPSETAAVPVLRSATVCVPGWPPTMRLPKETALRSSVSEPSPEGVTTLGSPFPLSGTCCAPPGALSRIVSAALRDPEAVGAKRAAIEHVWFGWIVVPLQPSDVIAKSPALVLCSPAVPNASGALPLLVMVTDWAAPAVPTSWSPNA